MKILVVHEERAVADYLAEFLRNCGYQTLPLYSAGEALDHLFWEIRFDVALICITLPILPGDELGDCYRIEVFQPNCRVILFGFEGVVENMKARRPDFEYLAIPFEHEHLLSILRETEIRVAH